MCYIYKKYINETIFVCPANKSNLVEKELREKLNKYELKLQLERVSTIEKGIN